jgi:hypothetical protein
MSRPTALYSVCRLGSHVLGPAVDSRMLQAYSPRCLLKPPGGPQVNRPFARPHSPQDNRGCHRRSCGKPGEQPVFSRALLMLANGVSIRATARELGTWPKTVMRWRDRFLAGDVEAVGKVTEGRGRRLWLPEGTVAEWCGSLSRKPPMTGRLIGPPARWRNGSESARTPWLGSVGTTISNRGRQRRSRSPTIPTSSPCWSTWSACI